MATITSAASGNWSDTSTWVGGVVPTAADDVVIAAGHVVTLDVDATIISLSGAAATTNWVDITTSRTLTCTGANGITAKSVANAGGLVRITGVGITVNINSILRGAAAIADNSPAVDISVNSTANIIGNIFSFGGGSTTNGAALNCAGASTVNVVGNIFGTTAGNSRSAIAANGGCTLNITGNLLGSTLSVALSAVDNIASACFINIIGNCTASTGPAINSTQSSTITVNGTVTASSARAAIVSTSTTSEVIVSTPVVNTNGYLAINSNGRVRLYQSPSSQWTFQNELNVDKILYSAGAALGNPATTDVRDGVTYASGALTGTLVVPSASSVTLGVVFDNGTIGTAQNTAASFLSELSSSTDPLAIRLQNVSTVDSTAATVAGFNV